MNSTDAATSPIINLSNINLTLGTSTSQVHILHDIELTINKQETVAIMGPSGSGKTSLMMLMAGLEAPTAGQIEVCGEDLGSKTEDQLALFRAKNIGVVFQSFHLIPTMTALENVIIPLEFINTPQARDVAKEALASVGLAERMHHYPSQLSGGEQQRVAIARACVTKPKLLLADEPTGNLDKDTGEQIIQLLTTLNRAQGTSLVIITHDMNVARHCSKIIRLEDGKIV